MSGRLALPKPSERERTEWYFQRYVAHLPAAGEMVVFDRSWYNRAGVEHVLGFCSDRRVLGVHPIGPGVRADARTVRYPDRQVLVLGVEQVQTKRFEERLRDPAKRWKFSDIDARSQAKWNEYSRAKDIMVEHTSSPRRRGGRLTVTTSVAPD